MADVFTAVQFVLRQEDPTLKGRVTFDPRDNGGRTRYGVAERFHPELTGTGFFDEQKMDSDHALGVAVDLYEEQYGTKLKLPQIKSQPVANAMLSFGINEGDTAAIKVLQQALGLDDDGVVGPVTLAAENQASESDLLLALSLKQKAHYEQIVANDPTQAKFLDGWLNRVDKCCQG